MYTATPLAPAAEKVDAHAIKQWAAEDFAIAIGLLRECPYHGQPFKAHTRLASKVLASGHIDPLDPNVRAFNGNTRELLAAVECVTRNYGDRCAFCAASDHQDDLD